VIEDGQQATGAVTTVVRIGETIRRHTGVWTPAVRALLEHLEQRGFRGAPRPRGIDEQGRVTLGLITTSLRCPPGGFLYKQRTTLLWSKCSRHAHAAGSVMAEA
jgi:hypothetical protein